MALDPKGGFDQIMSMARGFQVAKMLMVAVDLGLFDFLAEPRSAVETAAWLKAEPPGHRHLFEWPGGVGTPGQGRGLFQE